jgi:hypothetical protein
MLSFTASKIQITWDITSVRSVSDGTVCKNKRMHNWGSVPSKLECFDAERAWCNSGGESRKRNISVMNKFDTKAVRALLVTESKFITELLDKRNVPVPGDNDSGKSTYFSVPPDVLFAVRKVLCVCYVQYTQYTTWMLKSLCVIKNHAMKAYGMWRQLLNVFLTSVLDGG